MKISHSLSTKCRNDNLVLTLNNISQNNPNTLINVVNSLSGSNAFFTNITVTTLTASNIPTPSSTNLIVTNLKVDNLSGVNNLLTNVNSNIITASTLNTSSISSNLISMVSGTLSSAEIKTLNSVGTTVLPAVSGKTYIIYGAILTYNFVSTPYTIPEGVFLLSYGLFTGQNYASNTSDNGILGNTSSKMYILPAIFLSVGNSYNNTDIVFNCTAGNPSGGDGTLSYNIFYCLI